MKKLTLTALYGLLFALSAHAQVAIEAPWVRATVLQQKVTGGYMQITSTQDARLVEARSPLAGTIEIHEMNMNGDVMQMRPIDGIDLPAGKRVELKPGGYHLMLLKLKRTIKDGESVPLTLIVEDKDKKRSEVEVAATAKPLTAQHRH